MRLENQFFRYAQINIMKQELFIHELFQKNRKRFSSFPDKQIAEAFADELFNFLFASYEGKYPTEEKLFIEYSDLKNTFSALLYELEKNEETVKRHTGDFFGAIPGIYEKLLLDAEAILKFDPAARSIE